MLLKIMYRIVENFFNLKIVLCDIYFLIELMLKLFFNVIIIELGCFKIFLILLFDDIIFKLMVFLCLVVILKISKKNEVVIIFIVNIIFVIFFCFLVEK